MTEQEFCDWLSEKVQQALEDDLDNGDEDVPDVIFRSFEEAGLMTRDRGLVVRFSKPHDEFQVTIVRRR